MRLFPAVRLWPLSIGFLVALSIALSAFNLAPFPGRAWFQELNSDLEAYYFLLHLLSIPLVLALWKDLGKHFSLVLLANLVALSFFYATLLWPYYAPRREVPEDGAKFTVAFADLERLSEAPEKLAAVLSGKDAAIVGVTGVTPQNESSLQKLSPLLHVVSSVPRDDEYGAALLSEFPVVGDVRTSVADDLEDFPAVIKATLERPSGKNLVVVVLKLPPPFSHAEELEAELTLRRTSILLRHEKEDSIVLGNLNAAPTSSRYGKIEWMSISRNAMRGFGYEPNCCSKSWWIELPLSHILYHGWGLHVLNFERLPSLGGEYSPILAQFTG